MKKNFTVLVFSLALVSSQSNASSCSPYLKSPDPRGANYSYAQELFFSIGSPSGADQFLVKGQLIPTHELPLLHTQVLSLLENRWEENGGKELENTDIFVEFYYSAHFRFSGQFFDGLGWKDLSTEKLTVSLGMSAEGGYHGILPNPEDEVLMVFGKEDRPFSNWQYGANGCSNFAFVPAPDELSFLETCLAMNDCENAN